MLHNCPWCGYNSKEFIIGKPSLKHMMTCGNCGNISRVKISIPHIASLFLLAIPLANIKTHVIFIALSCALLCLSLYIYSILPYVQYKQKDKNKHEFIEKNIEINWKKYREGGLFLPELRIWDDEVLITNTTFDFGNKIKPFIIINRFSSLKKTNASVLIPSEVTLNNTFELIHDKKVIAVCKIVERVTQGDG